MKRKKDQDAHKPRVRGSDIVFEISKLRDAELVAKEVLKKRPRVYVALDLDRLKLSPADAAKWIERFVNSYRRMAIDQKLDDLPPSIAVFANEIDNAGEQALRRRNVEAVIFERSRVSNKDCQTPTQLAEKLLPQILKNDELAAQPRPKIPRRKMSPEEFKALNSYPPGVTPEDIDRLTKEFNQPEQADRWRGRSPEPKDGHAEQAKKRRKTGKREIE